MKIRNATIKDVKEIVKLSLEYGRYEENLNKDIKVKNLKAIEKQEKKWIKLGTKYIFAEKDNEILGMVAFNLGKIGKEKIGIIHTVIVREKARGKGVGDKLINYVLNYFKKNNCKRVKGFVHIKNKNALKFWTEHKFEKEKGFAIQKKLK
jgi:N-acetylglutamate synthase-like GNAT family acetyltransferase